jgi:hypothetical protein
LEPTGNCPECGTPIIRSLEGQLGKLSTENVTWARLVVLGLLAWLAITPFALMAVLRIESTSSQRPAMVNFPGPKVWGMPLQSQLTGVSIERNATDDYVVGLSSALAVFLLTARRLPEHTGEEPLFSLRRLARWLPIVLCGALFGSVCLDSSFMFSRDSSVGIALTVALLELPCTVLVHMYLAALCARLKLTIEARTLRLVALAAAVLMGIAVIQVNTINMGMGALQRNSMFRFIVAAYGAIGFATSAIAVVAVVRLILAMLPLAKLYSPTPAR